MWLKIFKELKAHIPFTAFGTLTGIVIMLILYATNISRSVSETLFWIFHPLHVFLSALVTTSMYRLHGQGKVLPTVLIGYFGCIGIATLSDCIIPYVGELLLNLPQRSVHLGFIEKWWLVNPLAFVGICFAYFRPQTKFPHAGHVLLSTWASLFHITMVCEQSVNFLLMTVVAVFLFFAVLLPCCTSDIIFPLLFVSKKQDNMSKIT